jgi:predicted GNAT superfamily acetyltransferase
MPDIEIRVCKTWDDALQCEELQKIVWDMPDYREVVPAHFLITAAKNGGLLIGAFQGSKMIGFAFGFLGSEGEGTARRFKHTSHMLGIVPEARALGLGAAIKWKQREEALKQGLDLMTWTYDPLQAVNAQLNLRRLGAVARRYIPMAYGEMTGALNAGVPSDRFEVEWYLDSQRVQQRRQAPPPAAFAEETLLFEVEWNAAGWPQILSEQELQGDRLLVEIPPEFNALKAQDPTLAVVWRMRTRNTLERALAAGYLASDVVVTRGQGAPVRVFYLLEKSSGNFI